MTWARLGWVPIGFGGVQLGSVGFGSGWVWLGLGLCWFENLLLFPVGGFQKNCRRLDDRTKIDGRGFILYGCVVFEAWCLLLEGGGGLEESENDITHFEGCPIRRHTRFEEASGNLMNPGIQKSKAVTNESVTICCRAPLREIRPFAPEGKISFQTNPQMSAAHIGRLGRTNN